MTKNKKIEIFILYLLLVAGGFWHLLGYFQTLMRWFAAPLLIVLALFLAWKMYAVNRDKQATFFIWSMIVLLGGFIFEAIGVKTGLIFGDYVYGDVLQPQINHVPIAIGFAWFGIQISSLGFAQWISRNRLKVNVLAMITALLMVLFDVLMEPSAIYLGYWTWANGHPPLHNYFGWLGLSLAFSLLGARLGLFQKTVPPFVRHAYIAQAIYFSLIFIKTVIV
ncbi:carotenoid biosynthesis protein [candidate division KSB1 bacterium]|nr:carotenoid biosynthesis protein [candidate division KSB1 bacterium]RQW03821.1 MAG: carotenoid biosynthesis protein [candidate division KSB1 bacterium]